MAVSSRFFFFVSFAIDRSASHTLCQPILGHVDRRRRNDRLLLEANAAARPLRDDVRCAVSSGDSRHTIGAFVHCALGSRPRDYRDSHYGQIVALRRRLYAANASLGEYELGPRKFSLHEAAGRLQNIRLVQTSFAVLRNSMERVRRQREILF